MVCMTDFSLPRMSQIMNKRHTGPALSSASKHAQGRIANASIFNAALSAVLSAALVACGGGGGGGGSGGGDGNGTTTPGTPLSQGPETPLQKTVTYADIAVASPMSSKTLHFDVMEGMSVDYMDITLNFSGNVDGYKGDGLYLLLEDKDHLLKHDEVTRISADEGKKTAYLRYPGAVMSKPGLYEGRFNVYACLDATCETQLKGSPVQIPYKVNVRRTLQASEATVNVTAKLGEKPATQSIPVQLPDGIIGDVTLFTPYMSPISAKFVRNGDDNTRGHLLIEFDPANVGNYAEKITLSAPIEPVYTTYPVQKSISKSISVNYSVMKSEDTRFATAPEFKFTMQADKYFFPYDGNFVPRWIAMDSGVVNKGHARVPGTGTYPAEAESYNWGKDGGWWSNDEYGSSMGGSPYIRVCKLSYSTQQASCLPRGTYTVDVNQYFSVDGGPKIAVPVKVTMVIE